ncbi:hypothetical protein [Burkholderia sp. WSM2230]|uniref:hypothetical protein n=1 Tax=Burkholderia sp. WSM2230 TaxID=944435 RepID=UPI00040E920A|nr:hypothetical protein [Burkholderia sp. WSM2230]
MIEMMKVTIGRASAGHRAQQQHALKLRRAVGFAIVTSGFAVIAAQALQHVFGG